MQRRERILLVEDESAIRELVAFHLEEAGYEALQADSGERGLSVALSEEPALVLLDLMLPGLDGSEVLRRLRRESRVPVIMLTARGAEADRVRGLELGADDYIVKPFSPAELVARVRAVLRRAGGDAQEIAVGPLRLDLLGHRCFVRDREVALTLTEFGLLQALMEHPGQVLSRDRLLERVWGYDFYGDARTVDVHVRHLREKIEENASEPQFVETVRGVGYRFGRSG